MLRIVALTIALLPLAACDAPDPSSFPKHALRESTATGSHISGTDSGDTVSTDDTHQIQRMTSGGNGLGGGGGGH